MVRRRESMRDSIFRWEGDEVVMGKEEGVRGRLVAADVFCVLRAGGWTAMLTDLMIFLLMKSACSEGW